MKDQRFTGTLLDGIPYPGTYRLHFGWVSSPEFKNENGKRIVCRFDVADVESGLEIIDRWDLYGSGVHGEHSDTCPSRGVRCDHGELCGGYPELKVSFVPELVQVMSHDHVKKTEVRAVVKSNGDPKLDEFDLPIFENVPVLNKYGQPEWEWVDAGMVDRWDARQLRFYCE